MSWLQFIALLTCTYNKSGDFSPIPTFNIRSCKIGAVQREKKKLKIAFLILANNEVLLEFCGAKLISIIRI